MFPKPKACTSSLFSGLGITCPTRPVGLTRCAAECAVRFEPVCQCGLFRYFDKVLPCGLCCGQVIDFRW